MLQVLTKALTVISLTPQQLFHRRQTKETENANLVDLTTNQAKKRPSPRAQSTSDEDSGSSKFETENIDPVSVKPVVKKGGKSSPVNKKARKKAATPPPKTAAVAKKANKKKVESDSDSDGLDFDSDSEPEIKVAPPRSRRARGTKAVTYALSSDDESSDEE